MNELDIEADKLRRDWFARKHAKQVAVCPWELIPERIKQNWRILALGGFFEKGFTDESINRGRPRKGQRVPRKLVQVKESRDDSLLVYNL